MSQTRTNGLAIVVGAVLSVFLVSAVAWALRPLLTVGVQYQPVDAAPLTDGGIGTYVDNETKELIYFNGTEATNCCGGGGGGGVTNPLTADLNTDTYKLKSSSTLLLEGGNTANSIDFDTAGSSGTKMRFKFNGTERVNFTSADTAQTGQLNLLSVVNGTANNLRMSNLSFTTTMGQGNAGLEISLGNNGLRLLSGNLASLYLVVDSTGTFPGVDLASTSGNSTHRWTEIHSRHFVTGQASAPACTPGAALGTGGSMGCVCTGSDTAMECTFTTGSSGAGTGTMGTIAYNTAFGAKPYCVLKASTSASQAGTHGYAMAIPRSSASTTAFDLTIINALSTGTAYAVVVHCIE